MRKRMGAVWLTVVLALIMTVIASPSFSQDVDIRLRWDSSVDKCGIEIHTRGNRFKGICGSGNNPMRCDSDHLTWTVMNENCTSEEFGPWKLQILDAPDHLSCFRPNAALPPGVVEEITQTGPGGAKSSGTPSQTCLQDKYGTYWPYVLSLYEQNSEGDWELEDTTDPGGIIFP